MKRLIRLCSRCSGDGCHHCDFTGQYGEDVRILSQNRSTETPSQRRVRSQSLVIPGIKIFDSVAAPTAVGWFGGLAVGVAPFAPISTASSAVLNQIPRGLSISNRVGRTVALQSLRVRGDLSYGSGVLQLQAACPTIWIIYQKQLTTPTVMPAWTTIFTAQSGIALLNISAMSEYELLYCWTGKAILTQAAGGISPTDFTTSTFDFTVPLDNRLTRWTTADATGAFTSMDQGALYIYYANGTTQSTGCLAMTLSTRLEFSDN